LLQVRFTISYASAALVQRWVHTFIGVDRNCVPQPSLRLRMPLAASRLAIDQP
jgi:hypothetical protein